MDFFLNVVVPVCGFAAGFLFAWDLNATARRLARNHQPTRTP